MQLAWLLLATGCALAPVDLRAKQCPCADGWTCDTRVGQCVQGELDVADSGLDRPAKDLEDAGPVDARLDAARPVSDGGAADALDAAPPGEAGPVDLPALDASPADAAIPDGSVGQPGDAGSQTDGGEPSFFPATACFASSTTVANCDLLRDGNHATGPSHKCVQGDDVCSFEGDCSPLGCIKDVWFAMDLGQARTISQLRFVSDWWSKRPRDYEVWASNSPSAVPNAGATLVTTGVGQRNPWHCVAGDLCADRSVPDQCCPNGRDAPQAPVSTTIPKYDIQDFPAYAARYWYLLVRDTYAPTNLILQEVEYWGAP